MDRSEEVTVVEPLPSPGLPEPVEEARRRRPRRVAAVASGTAAALVVGVLGVVALRDDGAGEDPGTVAVVTLTPADVAELRAAFEEMTRHMFDGSADLGDSGLSVVADGERLRAFVEPILTSNASIYEDMGAEVVDVWGEGVDRAGVSFRVLLNGEPYTFPLGPDPSGPKELTLEAVKVDGAWKYTLESVCEMLATFGFPCPPEVRDPSYQDVTAAAEGQEVAALLERFLASGASIEEQVALVEDGERLRESIAAVSGAIEGYEVGTRVDRVLVSPGRPRAAVRFSLALDGVPVLRVTGDVVRGPQGWLLGHRTACEVVGSTWAIGVVAVDCTPGPGTSWADEPAPDLAAPDLSTDPVEPQVESAVARWWRS
ncbi:MAG: hypothetical protein M5U14_02160 [Acidimicrobiia bacterium]|nr:hypothetical protein [Acidimicrobiia bacterium]